MLDRDVSTQGGSAADEPGSVGSSLLVGLRSRDPDAWCRLAVLYTPVVYGWCRRAGLRPEDAADVVQESFLAVARNIDRFRRTAPTDTFAGWLWRIVQNKIRDQWRREACSPRAAGGSTANERLHELPAIDGETSQTPDADSPHSLFRQALARVRSEFEENTWQAFWRIAVDGRNSAEVAAELGMSRGAVYMAKSRVLSRFREEFGELVE